MRDDFVDENGSAEATGKPVGSQFIRGMCRPVEQLIADPAVLHELVQVLIPRSRDIGNFILLCQGLACFAIEAEHAFEILREVGADIAVGHEERFQRFRRVFGTKLVIHASAFRIVKGYPGAFQFLLVVFHLRLKTIGNMGLQTFSNCILHHVADMAGNLLLDCKAESNHAVMMAAATYLLLSSGLRIAALGGR